MIAPARVPAGVLSLTGEAARRQRAAESGSLDLLLARGFELLHLPVLEYGSEDGGAGYRFVDASGRLVVVRTDFTPLAARVLGRRLASGGPLDICYSGEVVRPQPTRLRRLPELFQVGFESYGRAAAGEATLELLLDVLAEIGVAPDACHLTVGESSVAARMAAQVLEETPDDDVLECLNTRDLDGVADLVGGVTTAVERLGAALLGDPPDRWAPFFGLEPEAERMTALAAVGRSRGMASSIDVAPPASLGYYHGTTFTVWGRTSKASLASGGEYRIELEDDTVPAAGATVTMGLALLEATC